jgi:putative transport protein
VWLQELLRGDGVPHAIFILGVVGAFGLLLGSLKAGRLQLGVAGVLFVGIAFGHFGVTIDDRTLDFVREFGLVLFVYSIGMQVGPGFLSAFKRDGLALNGLAAAVVLLGALVTVGLVAGGIDGPTAVGLFSGATTNTPSLGAAQQILKQLPGAEAVVHLPGLGYAVAYPFGIVGVIVVMVLLRALFRVDVAREADALVRAETASRPQVSSVSLRVTNPNLDGVTVDRLPFVTEHGMVISRLLHEGRVEVARPDSTLHVGDSLMVVGPPDRLEELRLVIGERSSIDVKAVPSPITSRRVVVTRKDAIGKRLSELGLRDRHNVTVTRVSRADVVFSPPRGYRTQFGDTLLVVGEAAAIDAAAHTVGDSAKELSTPHLVPIFVGIALGVMLGSIPLLIPGVPVPVKLGLAGGPLLVAIVLSRVGRIGPLFWYLPISANFMLRELGIALFLACVGLRAGDRFVDTVLGGGGLYLLAAGALITVAPLLVVALLARLFMKVNFVRLLGLLAGSMTDPPALSFATSLAGGDAPSVAYSTVYPLVMLLRVVAAQTLVLVLA